MKYNPARANLLVKKTKTDKFDVDFEDAVAQLEQAETPYTQLLLACGVTLSAEQVQEMTPPPEVDHVQSFKKSWGDGKTYQGTTSFITCEFPHYYDGDLPVFTTQQLEYGRPEDYGHGYNYRVVELNRDIPISVYVSDGNNQDKNSGVEIKKLRPPHLYFVRDRFKSTLKHLLGYSGNIPSKIIDTIQDLGVDWHPMTMWSQIRRILKQHKWSRYYNNIPLIIAQLRVFNLPYKPDCFLKILADFDKLQKQWPIVKDPSDPKKKRFLINVYGRKYFPNLRYIALRLMGEYGIVFPYKIPLAIVPKTSQALDVIYSSLWKKQDDLQDLLDMFD